MNALAVGDNVIVKIYRKWRHGRVVWMGRSRVEVEYATPHAVMPTRRCIFPIKDVCIPEPEPKA